MQDHHGYGKSSHPCRQKRFHFLLCGAGGGDPDVHDRGCETCLTVTNTMPCPDDAAANDSFLTFFTVFDGSAICLMFIYMRYQILL